MPGLAIKINYTSQTNTKKCLERISNAYKVPSISYNENYLSDENTFFYSLLPKFISEDRLGRLFNGRYIVAIDGEFYNQAELNTLMNLKNASKLETLLHLYLNKGENFAKYINGEFVIVIYDLKEKSFIVTNDRFGRRVLFWYKANETYIFASEKKGILVLAENTFKINPSGLLEVFSFNHNLAGRTYIEGVKVLQPASVFSYYRKSCKLQYYNSWQFDKPIKDFSRHEHLQKIKNALVQATNIRLEGKSRLLLWLSGGYDSRALACSVKEKYRHLIVTDTFGENHSDEVEIAKLLANRLKYKWRHQKVESSYLKLGKLGTWRTEFSVSAFGHPFIGKHKTMKNVADYIIQGVPGLNEINSGHLKIGKILAAIKPNTYENYFRIYGRDIQELSIIFNNKFLKENYKKIHDNFISVFENFKSPNDLYKWDMFNLTQRQPNFSYMADLVENDLFETIHPFTDINLIPLFTQIPLKNKLFLQLTKDLFSNYFPEVKDVPFGDGRGLIKSNNNLLNTFYQEAKRTLSSSSSIIWNKKKSIFAEYEQIKIFVMESLEKHYVLQNYLDKNKIHNFFNDKEKVIQNIGIVDLLVTFLFSYEQLLSENKIVIPDYIINHYKE